MNDNIEKKVLEFVRKACEEYGHLPDSFELSKNTSVSELHLDSLKLVEIVFELENALSLPSDEELLAELKTLGDIMSMFEKNI